MSVFFSVSDVFISQTLTTGGVGVPGAAAVEEIKEEEKEDIIGPVDTNDAANWEKRVIGGRIRIVYLGVFLFTGHLTHIIYQYIHIHIHIHI